MSKNTIKVELTMQQAWLCLHALGNEGVNDEYEFGEYSYERCRSDLAKKFIKAGYDGKTW